jgi:predicted Zn-dependent protease
MRDLARFYLRQRDLAKAELYLRDAYSFQLDDKATALAYACLLCQLSRSQEASVILKKLIDESYEPVKVNMLLSIAY